MASECQLSGELERLIMIEQLETKRFCEENRRLFSQVNDALERSVEVSDKVYNCLDYDAIMTMMCEYIDGFFEYKGENEDKYGGKIISSTVAFYGKMFSDKKYRRELNISDFSDINKEFIIATKKLQTKLEQCLEKVADDHDRDIEQMYTITNRQYKKIAKVFYDDSRLVLWIRDQEVRGAKFGTDKCFNPGKQAISDFNNKSTPVIHAGTLNKND
jgi:adenylosuccinate synthase